MGREPTPRADEPAKPTEGKTTQDPRVLAARTELLEGVGRDIAASFPGITRLGGQIVAALYLAESAMSMDELAELLGRDKSNIFGNLRALEAAGIVERRREGGARHDLFALKGKYPDVVIGAYLSRLRSVVADKCALSRWRCSETPRAKRLTGSAIASISSSPSTSASPSWWTSSSPRPTGPSTCSP